MAQVLLKVDLSPNAMLILNELQPGAGALTETDADLLYLRLDTVNNPLTDTLSAEHIYPNGGGNYNLGDGILSGDNDWNRLNANLASIVRVAGLGATSTTSIGSAANALGCTVQAGNATGTAELIIGGSSAIHVCMGAAAFNSHAGDTCTIEMLGTSGTNLGSAVNVIGDAGATALLQFTAASSGGMNLGSVAMEPGASSGSLIISGDGVFNAGNVRPSSNATMTLSGDTVVNLGTLLGGTLTISGDSSFNLGTIENSGSATIGGIGCYNLAHVNVGALSITGDDCFNIGSIEDSGSTITLAGTNVQNLMSVNTGADVSVSAGAAGVFCRGLATGASTVSLTEDGAAIQGYFLGRAATNITASGVGSFLSGAVDVSAASSTPGTVTMTSAGPGSLLFGSISAAAGGSGASSLTSSGAGSVVLGHILLSSASAATIEATNTASFAGGACLSGLIQSAGLGSHAYGYVTGTSAQLIANNTGALCSGAATATSTGASTLTSSNVGSAIIGVSQNIGTGTAGITASGISAIVLGGVSAGGSANAAINATGSGSIVLGYAVRSFSTSALIESTTQGSVVIGLAQGGTLTANTGTGCFVRGSVSGAGTISSTGGGSEASGRCIGQTISSSGLGSTATGYATGNGITASANGAFAQGDSTNGAITASAANAVQFGPGVNAEASTLKIGTAGLRLKGTAGAPGTPVNGDIYMGSTGNAFVQLQSNAAVVTLGPVNTWTTGAHATRRDFTGTTTAAEALELLETLIEDLRIANLI
jgi:hypothetical protein